MLLFHGELHVARKPDPDRESFWRELVVRRERLSLTVAEICGQAGVSPASFFFWQRRLRQQKTGGRGAELLEAQPPAALVPVRILADRADANPHPQTNHPHPSIVIEWPGQVRVQIPPGCDVPTIQAVLQEVAAIRAGGSSPC